MRWPYSQMTDLASLFDIWRLGTAQVFANLLHIVRLIRRQAAGDNCVNAGLGDVLPLPPSESSFATGLCCAVVLTAFSWEKLFKTCLHTIKQYFEIIDSACAMLISGFLNDFTLISQTGSWKVSMGLIIILFKLCTLANSQKSWVRQDFRTLSLQTLSIIWTHLATSIYKKKKIAVSIH